MRNIASTNLPGFRIRRTYDLIALPRHIVYRFMPRTMFKRTRGKILDYLINLHCELPGIRTDINHFFNCLSVSKTPWVVTFETRLPRWNQHSRFGLSLLARDICKRMIALSRNCYDMQFQHLLECGWQDNKITEKMVVLHPPQKVIADSTKKFVQVKENLHFAIVGADFFRKGGMETLLVFDRLLSESAPIRLTIVSLMQYGDYACCAKLETYRRAIELIHKWSDHIEYHRSLPNESVIKIYQNADIGLLPTWDDTYGYTVLESQACGCPVISTNIRALPEINSTETGWILPVPKDKHGKAIIGTKDEREEFSHILVESLHACISDILSNRSSVRTKGKKALARIRRDHDPAEHARQQMRIYSEALQ